MATLPERIIDLLRQSPGLTDREITTALLGVTAPQQPVNQACHRLESNRIIERGRRQDGLIGNYLKAAAGALQTVQASTDQDISDSLSEDALKKALDEWLRREGWQTRIAWGQSRGVDVEARRGSERWIIEVKGRGKYRQVQGNYFLGALSELLQRMNDPQARYSLALPDLPAYRGLWARLPPLAKARTQITVLFIDDRGTVTVAT